jgi:hypothetical protein
MRIIRYKQPAIGVTETHISVQPVEFMAETTSIYQTLNDYDIEPFGKGPETIEMLLAHILRTKLDVNIRKDPDIWTNTLVIKINCDLRGSKSNKYFQKGSIKQDKLFLDEEGGARMKDAVKYADDMENGDIFPLPLYVSGRVLNSIGGNTDPFHMFMVDGARRITAAALNGYKTMDMYMIILGSELRDCVDESLVQNVKKDIDKISTYPNYQAIPSLGIPGARADNRFSFINKKILKNRLVADYGCNIGQTCIQIMQAGAKKIVGLEGSYDTFKAAITIRDILGAKDIEYHNIDFNAKHFEDRLNEVMPDKVDYSFFLSVYRTENLLHKDRLFQYIIDHTTVGIFFEGHNDSTIDTIEYYTDLFKLQKLSWEFLGYTEDFVRPFFYLAMD